MLIIKMKINLKYGVHEIKIQFCSISKFKLTCNQQQCFKRGKNFAFIFKLFINYFEPFIMIYCLLLCNLKTEPEVITIL